jgi:putative MFS transporter
VTQTTATPTAALPFCEVAFHPTDIEYRITAPFIGTIFRPLIWHRSRAIQRALAAGHPTPLAAPWWGPPAAMDETANVTLSLGCLLAALIGYGGALLTQTNAYAADVYGVGDAALGVGLAVTRVGVVIAVVLGLTADRFGRRSFINRAVVAQVMVTAITGLAPTFGIFIAGHTVIRALDTALGVALAVLVAESVPAAARAYSVALVGVFGGLGIFVASMLLPVASRGAPGLAAVHLIQLAALPVILRTRPRLVESARYTAHAAERGSISEVLRPPYRRIVAKAGGALFLGFLFLGPAVEFMNRYLDHDLGFSSAQILLFLLLSSLPFMPMTAIGARQADIRGRKPVAVLCISAAAVAYAAIFLVQSPWVWPLGPLASTFAAPGYAAISVYSSELFPTRLRSTAGTVVHLIGVAGAAVGLLLAGQLGERFGTGHGLALLVAFPLCAALLVAVSFPETANRELEDTSNDLQPQAMDLRR